MATYHTEDRTASQLYSNLLDQFVSLSTAFKEVVEQKQRLLLRQQRLLEEQDAIFEQQHILAEQESTLMDQQAALWVQLSLNES